MRTKYRCSRCLRTFDEPHEADQHEHEGAVETSIREIEAREERETQQTRFAEWGADAFERAGEIEETDDGR